VAKPKLGEKNKTSYIITYKDNDPSQIQDIAIGVVVPKMTPNAMDYLKNVKDFNATVNQGVKEQIKLCRKLYTFDEILGTAIDVFTEMLVTDYFIENVKNQACFRLLEYFFEEVNTSNPNTFPGAKKLARQIAHQYFVDGNVFLYETWSTVSNKSYKFRSRNLPTQITCLNSLLIEMPEEFCDFGKKPIYFKINENVIALLKKKNRTKEEEEYLSLVPKTIRDAAKRPDWNGFIRLSEQYTTHMKRKGQDFEVWGTPYLTRAFKASAAKERLRILDNATTEGLVNYITLFKIGDPDNKATLSQPRINAFAAMLRNPAASNTLVWTYDVSVDTVGPKDAVLSFTDRYKQVNYDILSALGIPEMLFTGQGSQAGVQTSVTALVKRLEKAQEDISKYFEIILRKICIQNGFENEMPKVRWSKLQAGNDMLIKNLILQLYDRGLLPVRTALYELGYDYTVQREHRQKENSIKDEEIFTRRDVPFSPQGKDAKAPSKFKKEVGRPTKETKDEKVEKADSFESATQDLLYGRIDDLTNRVNDKIKAKNDIESIIVEIGFAFIKLDRDVDSVIAAIVKTAKEYGSVDNKIDIEGLELRTELEDKSRIIRDNIILVANEISEEGQNLNEIILLIQKSKEEIEDINQSLIKFGNSFSL
jgi:hypothetical protein